MNELTNEIKNYQPTTESEVNDKKLILKYIDESDNILLRDNETYHFTTSAWIVNKDRTKLLMVYHNLYDSWAWVGGHADGDPDLRRVIRKEIEEETGITNIKFLSNDIYGLNIISVDGHIKRGKYVSSHVHLDIEFLIEANEEDELRINEYENSNVKWIDIDKVVEITTETKMIRIYEHFIKKTKSF